MIVSEVSEVIKNKMAAEDMRILFRRIQTKTERGIKLTLHPEELEDLNPNRR